MDVLQYMCLFCLNVVFDIYCVEKCAYIERGLRVVSFVYFIVQCTPNRCKQSAGNLCV